MERGTGAGLGFPEGDAALTGAERRSDATWRRHFVFGSVRAVAEELGMSHYACNFYIYVSTSSLFRRQLTRTLAALFPRCDDARQTAQPPGDLSSAHTSRV